MYEEAQTELFTIRDLLRFTISRFHEEGVFFGHGSNNAHDEAAYLISYALNLEPSSIDAYLDARLVRPEVAKVLDLVQRRIRDRVPAAYLTNEAWLGEYRFYIDQRAIVPRSFIAEIILDHASPWVQNPADVTSALDLCTGSGCLAVLMALSFSYAKVDAADISKDALEVAERNVADYGLHSQINLIRSDLFQGLAGNVYDLIVSNPPYVDARSMASLPMEYLHEPRIALDGGEDGLRFIRAILENADKHLSEKGLLIVEVGNQRIEVEEAYPNLPFTWVSTQGDDSHVFLLHKADLAPRK